MSCADGMRGRWYRCAKAGCVTRIWRNASAWQVPYTRAIGRWPGRGRAGPALPTVWVKLIGTPDLRGCSGSGVLLDEPPQLAHIVERRELVVVELQAELSFDGEHQTDLGQRVPVRHIRGGQVIGQDEVTVLHDGAEDFLKPLVHVHALSFAAFSRVMNPGLGGV